MLRLSKLADYAVVVLVRLSHHDGEVTTSPTLAQATGVPEPTVAKVLKALCAAGLVASTRGARGGYRLVRPLHAIPVAVVIRAIDGPISLTACVDGATGGCEAQEICPRAGALGPGQRGDPRRPDPYHAGPDGRAAALRRRPRRPPSRPSSPCPSSSCRVRPRCLPLPRP